MDIQGDTMADRSCERLISSREAVSLLGIDRRAGLSTALRSFGLVPVGRIEKELAWCRDDVLALLEKECCLCNRIPVIVFDGLDYCRHHQIEWLSGEFERQMGAAGWERLGGSWIRYGLIIKSRFIFRKWRMNRNELPPLFA